MWKLLSSIKPDGNIPWCITIKVIANVEWRDMFSESNVEGLAARYLDHIPLLLNCKGKWQSWRRKNNLFKFKASWLTDEECARIIEREWKVKASSNAAMTEVQDSLVQCSEALTRWNRIRVPVNEVTIRKS